MRPVLSRFRILFSTHFLRLLLYEQIDDGVRAGIGARISLAYLNSICTYVDTYIEYSIDMILIISRPHSVAIKYYSSHIWACRATKED